MKKLQLGIDAMEFIKSIPDEEWKTIDTVVWDPPYYKSGIGSIGYHGDPIKFDNKMVMKKDKLNEIKEYIDNKITPTYIKFHTNIEEINTKNKVLVWYKSNVSHTAMNGNCEFIEINYMWEWKRNKSKVISIPLKYNTRPCNKPLKLWLELFKIINSKVILDPFAGYGSSIRAAYKLGLDIYACDIDKSLKHTWRQQTKYTQKPTF